MSSHDEYRGHKGESDVDPIGNGGFDEGRVDERFADWVDGRLSSVEEAGLEAEMAADDDLRRWAEEYRDTVAMLRAHLPSVEEPPAALAASVMAQMPGRRSRLVPFLASLTAAAAMVILYVVLDRLTGTPVPEERAAANLESNDADAVYQRVGGSRDPGREELEREKFAGGLARTEPKQGKFEGGVEQLAEEAEEKAGVARHRDARKQPQQPARMPSADPSMLDGTQLAKRKAVQTESKNGVGAVGGKAAPARREAESKDKSTPDAARKVETPGAAKVADGKPAGPGSPSGVARRGRGSANTGPKTEERQAQKEGKDVPAESGVPEVRRLRDDKLAGNRNADPKKVSDTGSTDSVRALAEEFLRDRLLAERPNENDATKGGTAKGGGAKSDAGKERSRGGGRGGRGAGASLGETSVLVLTLSDGASVASPPKNTNVGSNDPATKAPDKGFAERGKFVEEDKATDGKADDKKTADEKKKSVRSRQKVATKGQTGSDTGDARNQAGSGAKSGKKADATRSLLDFFQRRSVENQDRSKTEAVAVRLPLERFERLRSSYFVPAKPQKDAGEDYAHAPGDEVYLVSGDRPQMRELFAELRRYLDASSTPLPSAKVVSAEKAAPVGANKQAARDVSVRVERYAGPVGGSTRAWRAPKKRGADDGKVEFLLVLRRR